ncbi:helix-turn-helix transcriptional regulator [Halostella litorea]|uniref:helix-turn-helix transcriptional regulator n=1 Tax=Halostella litorea TaxID=2528831 RepID=UPI0010932C62|nr:GntR family transcriptional regulator [Halostella litorea]
MTRADAEPDVVGLVTRRFGVLDRLDGERTDKATLAEDLSVSRSTVDRALRELEGAGFVTRADGEYTASATGRLAARSYREFVGSVEALRDAAPVLAALPPEAPVSLDLLRGATVRLAEPPTPFRPVERLTDLVTDATEFRGLSAAVTAPETVERISAAAVEGDLRVEMVLADHVADQLRATHPEVVRAAGGGAAFDLYETDTVPFGLAVAHDDGDAHAVLAAYGPDSELRGIVVNDAPAAVDWADAVFEEYRATATPLRPP